MTSRIDARALDHLSWLQHGVMARRQLLEAGATDNDVERWIRRRQLAVVFPGVYVNHTGPLTSAQREWSAVLAAWPAALSHESALPALRPDRIQVAIDVRRTVDVPGVLVHRMANLDARADWRSAPPRIKTAEAIIDVMSARIAGDDIAGAYAGLATVCFVSIRPERVAAALARRARVPGRRLITAMLRDLEEGLCSVLERGYHDRVERPHGLPRARRQRRSLATGRPTDQGVRYEEYGVIVELDGRTHDGPAARDRDARRDLAELATSDAVTARVTYGLVFRDSCSTALWIDQILRRRGWRGDFRCCPRCDPP